MIQQQKENSTPISLPKISIVMPSYNQAGFIEKSIESVLAQSYPNLELIVMDGGSDDGTINILKKYEKRLVWVSEQDNGQAHAINKGFQLATGDILAYLNTDDLLEPGCLQRVAETFEKNPAALWLTGRCRNIDEDGQEIRGLIAAYKNILLDFRNYHLLLIVDFIAQPATFWRKELLQQAGLLNEALRYNMDYDLFLRFWRIKSPVYLREYIASFRIHQQSKTTFSGTSPEYLREDREFIRWHTAHPLLLFLHDFHRLAITVTYSWLQEREKNTARAVT